MQTLAVNKSVWACPPRSRRSKKDVFVGDIVGIVKFSRDNHGVVNGFFSESGERTWSSF
jgi:hypothetical protein